MLHPEILFIHYTFTSPRIKYLHVLRSERYGNDCGSMPGSDTQLRVTPFYGE